MNSIGIDIGYSTLKFIVLNNEKKQIFQICKLHRGNVHSLLKKELNNIMTLFNFKDCYIGFIGEHSKSFKKYNINDISALTEGVMHTNKNTKSIIEIGAQSSKYITGFSHTSKANIKFFMNSSCSAGTGSFLDEQVSRLGIKSSEFSDYIQRATQIPRIAGRCSVFSKTDMIHHQQEGVKIEDILLGLSYALARNFKANIVQRNKVEKPVMFVGGVANNKGVIRALKDIFEFSDDDIIIPDLCSNIGALGAALISKDQKIICNIEKFIGEIDKISTQNKYSSSYVPLLEYGTGDSIDKHNCMISNDQIIEGHIGVDIGSTSTNVVLIDKDKEVLAYRYIRTKGNPEKAAVSGIDSIKKEFHNKLNIKSIGTTGSGRSMIGKKIGASLVVNEITAQARGAVEIDKDVDTIFEIGGQDSKYIKIENGKVVDFEMNKICAAGTGSFIEEQSKKLEIPIEKFENIALKGNEPSNLGDKCTVFIEGNISKAIAEGKSKENIAAGLGYSIVNNYLNRVVGNKNIGNKIFLQGGIAHNQAIINAFRSTLKKEIVIPKFFSVTGAYGVALLTKEHVEKTKLTLDLTEEKNIIPTEIRDVESEIEKFLLKGYTAKIDPNKLTVGIPRVLFIHKLFPIFNEFFKELGFNVILTGHSDKEIVTLSQEYSMGDTCYPVKLINGHVAKLINEKVDYIFLPSLHTMKHPVSKTREDYGCVYMQSFPQMVSHVMDLENKGIKLLSPSLSFKFGKKHMMNTLFTLGKDLGKSESKTTLAINKGMDRFEEFEHEVENLGEEVISNLNKDEKIFVMITRTYGIADKGLNMEIPKKLRAMGYKVLTLSNLPAHSCDLSEDYPNMYWSLGQHILSGARIVKETKNLHAIYLTNHGCGPDTMLSHYFKKEMGDKPYLHLEVDEHASNIGVLTRLEAFVESLKVDNNNSTENPMINTNNQETIKENNIESYEKTIYIPNVYPYSNILQTILMKKGINAKLLSSTNKESLEIGKKESITKEYLSLMAIMGDVFSNLENIKETNASIFIPQDEGNETFGQYSQLLKQKIGTTKFKNINIESPFVEDLLKDENYGIDFGLTLIAGDLIMASDKKYRDSYLNKILKSINLNSFNKELLIDIANNIHTELSNENYKKNIYVLGEFSIIFNSLLNNHQLEKLEKKNKIYYMPVSEMMCFKWMDYLKKEKTEHKKLKHNLKIIKEIMTQVSKSLKEYSPFDKDLNEMFEISDSKLPLYSGGNGRYRMIKQFRCSDEINGILTLNSMYENTGTILKILRDKYNDELKHPIIDLSFDGSEHSDNNDKIENFIYYI